MNEIFEKVSRRLYKRSYERADGLTAIYYARFTCRLKKKRRLIPLGVDLATAQAKVQKYQVYDKDRYDFDLDPQRILDRQRRQELEPAPERLTIAKYIPRFLETKQGMASHEFYEDRCWHIERILGHVPLDEITRSKIAEYKRIRLGEPIYRWGKEKTLKAVDGSKVSPSTVNREITTLIMLLNLAAEDGVLEKIPATRKLKEPEGYRSRERVLDADEYKALLDASPRWLQRVIICAYEACLSRVDLMTLTRDEVQRKRPEAALIKLMGGRNKTKAKQKVPISPELWAVLDEIEAEQRKVTNLQAPNLVFTRDGQPINRHVLRKAFERAKSKAELRDFHFHDLRHCSLTKWALAGIPEELRKLAAGHSRGSVHQRYINPPDEEMVKVFAKCLRWKNGNRVATKELQKAGVSGN